MKIRILKALKENKDGYISGAKLAENLEVSRTAVWKHINQLKKEGYNIVSVSSKGYRLLEDQSLMTREEIFLGIKDLSFLDEVYYFDTIGSTNTYIKEIEGKNSGQQLLVISDEQTAGRGRLGRKWESPKGDGIWMSLLLRPRISPFEASKITQIAAAALVEALRNVLGIDVKIKWPNDLILSGKKLAGVLTEMNAELSSVNYVVLGCGINVNTIEFPDDLKDKATSLKLELDKEINKKDIIVSFIRAFYKLYSSFEKAGDYEETLKICRENSATLGKQVRVISGDTVEIGKAIDLNSNGELIIEDENGDQKTIFYGEVSVRGINGYL
ncbi:MAG: biotin--[acetyl-CoA-carboxylase] ligase [Firmicutes bacterium]|jgi:BirA family biotin operon repressor/biotin-[acetyl-CoA-carboxylase] ligase|nr:biotin--[acetyl-CoA-carboxylase] ligase [Bacillota bacterium]